MELEEVVGKITCTFKDSKLNRSWFIIKSKKRKIKVKVNEFILNPNIKLRKTIKMTYNPLLEIKGYSRRTYKVQSYEFLD